MWIEEWEAFQTQAQALFLASPHRTRLVIKYRHADALLVAKVTDDVTTIKFKTDEAGELRLLDKLSAWFATEAANPERAPKLSADVIAERMRNRVRNAERRKERAARAATKPVKAAGDAGVPLSVVRHKQKVAAKRAAKWARREERKMVAAAAGAKPAAGGAAVGGAGTAAAPTPKKA